MTDLNLKALKVDHYVANFETAASLLSKILHLLHISKYIYNGAVAVAQLVERLLLTPQVRGSNSFIEKLYLTYILSTVSKRRKRGQEWPISKIPL